MQLDRIRTKEQLKRAEIGLAISGLRLFQERLKFFSYNLVYLKMLLRRIHYILRRRFEFVHYLGVWELEKNSVSKIAEKFVLFAPKNEYLVLKKCRESSTIEGNTKVFRFGSELFNNVVIKSCHTSE